MKNIRKIQTMMDLNPKQPEFVLATSDYKKKYFMKYNIAHFYQFTAEYDHMGVIPDACIDILFAKKDGKLITRIAGSILEKCETNTELNGEYFGVRFMPGYNPINEIIKISELMNNEFSLDDIIFPNSHKEELLESIFFAETFEEKINAFMNFYSAIYSDISEDNNSLKNILLNKILQSNGNIKLLDLSEHTNYSERYLNKKIHEEFGMNPKSLIRFIRFQKSVSALLNSSQNISGVDTALDSGYYDQSHFIKEFKKLSGLTPSGYISNLMTQSYDKKLKVLN